MDYGLPYLQSRDFQSKIPTIRISITISWESLLGSLNAGGDNLSGSSLVRSKTQSQEDSSESGVRYMNDEPSAARRAFINMGLYMIMYYYNYDDRFVQNRNHKQFSASPSN